MPPENSCGNWRARVAASGRPASDSRPAMRSPMVEPTTYFLAMYHASSSFTPALIRPSATRQRVSDPGTHSSANRAMILSSSSPLLPILTRASLAAAIRSGSSLEPRKVSSSLPLSSTSSPARALANSERFSWSMSMLLATNASLTWVPMRHTGFRLLIGSCGTRPILLPRSLSKSFCLKPEISWPSSLMEPPTTWPVPGSRPSTAMAEVDLPEPDSPTMATHWPGYTLKDELRTACTALPSSVVKSTWRFLTSNSGPWARCMASRLFSVFISVIEYPFTYTQAVRLFGSSASLTASPIMMNASTVMASAADG